MHLPQRFAMPLTIMLDSLCMAVVMSFSLTLLRTGFAEGWLEQCALNLARAFPIATAASFLILPRVRRLVDGLTAVQSGPQ
jgi:uncharacterized protein DUF2798